MSDRRVEIALRFGGGLDFYLTENIVVSAEASYLMPTGKLNGLDYYSIGVGLQYRF
jgi:opacity protein-like surface antigen